jgi:SurA-like N-terminal domain
MLDTIRSKTKTTTVYVILGAIIVTFILGFGPASQKIGSSCSGTQDDLATIDGNNITTQDWKFSVHFAGRLFGRSKMGTMAMRRIAMDKLIEREILQDLANKNGIHFERRDAEDMIINNKIIILGMEMPLHYLGGYPSDSKTGKPGNFNYSLFKRWVGSIGGFIDENQFLDQIVKEMEANAYKESFVVGSIFSKKAQWMDYQNDTIGITFKAARFIPSSFMDGIVVSNEAIKAFIESKDGKIAAEAEYKRFSSKYTKGVALRKVSVLKFKMKMEDLLANLHADVQGQPKKDLESLIVALPKYAKVFNWLKTQKKEITLANMKKAAADMGEKGEFKQIDWFSIASGKESIEFKKAVFAAKVGKTSNGPLFTKDGAILFVVEKEKFSKLDKKVGLKKAASYLLTLKKADKVCLQTAQDVLKKLKSGVKAEDIKDLPEMITEGPINPTSEGSRVISRELATEIWKLEKNGSVLPKVVPVGAGAMKSYKIYILTERNLPSREDFLSMISENSGGVINRKAVTSFNISMKKMCEEIVNAGGLEMKPELTRTLTSVRPKNLKKEQLKGLPPEKYRPCFYLGGN